MRQWIIFIIIFNYACANRPNKIHNMKIMDANFSIISNPNSSKTLLLKALKEFDQASDEPSTFWVDISNNNAYNDDHRRRAIFMLFKRHISNDITLYELSTHLKKPDWVKIENLQIVQTVGGGLPVNFNFDDTIIVVQIFPSLSDGRWENWAIYLRIEGKISLENFYKIISGSGRKGKSELNGRRLLEFGLSPDDPAVDH